MNNKMLLPSYQNQSPSTHVILKDDECTRAQNIHNANENNPDSDYLDDIHDHSHIDTQLSGPRSSFSGHLGKQRQYWRDIILGINDGLVSTFLLVIGVSGGGLTSHDILITAIAGSLAGSISMFSGEYMATKSQDEVLEGEINLENHHIQTSRRDEINELPELLSLIGIPVVGEDLLRKQLLDFYSSNEDALLKVMIALEFGVLEKERRKPCFAGLTSGCLFFLGSLPSMLPFTICNDPHDGLCLAVICTVVMLLVVGLVKSFATRMSWFYSSIENLVITGLGGIFAYGIGSWLS